VAVLIPMVTLLALAGSPKSPLSANWPQQPTAYRGVSWGASEREASDKIHEADELILSSPPTKFSRIPTFDCKDGKLSDVVVRNCERYFTISNSPVPLSPLRFALPVARVAVEDTMIFHENKLVAVKWTFDSDGYDKVRAVMVEKYGAPMVATREKVHNAFGAEYENEKLTWAGDIVSVTLGRFGDDIKHSTGLFVVGSFRPIILKAEAEEIKKAKDAF